MIHVRQADAADISAILSLWAAADAEPTVTDDESALECLLAHANDSLIVAVDEEQVVGSLIVGWDGWRGSFYRLAVHPKWRRQGVGRQLVNWGERQLARHGARRISVFAVASDPRAVPFWEAVGYTAQRDRQRLVKNDLPGAAV